MNIHFTDKKLKKQLDKSTIFEIEVGSGMYGLKTPESDTDILKIYLEGSLNLTSITSTHHQLQYNDTENNMDYIYTSLSQFIKNIISGDSTINYEVLESPEFKKKFPNLFFFVNKLDKINTVKSYLGMAKRDIKLFKKEPSNKKAYHIQRGILFANCIMRDGDIFETLETMRTHLDKIRNSRVILLDLEYIETRMNELRESIKDKQFKPRSLDMYNINEVISNIYYNNTSIQQTSIDYNSLIEYAIYEEKFNY